MPDIRTQRRSWFLPGLGGGAGSVLYLLRDLFNTDRAAGSVNGTLAEPTGQTRTVTDGNNKLAVISGNLDFSTGGAGAGDPGLWYPAITRILGRIFIAKITPTNTNGAISAGWDSAASGSILDAIVFNAGGVIAIRVNGTLINVGVYSAGVSYTVTGIERTAGMLWLIKGGSFTFFQLLYLSILGSGVTLPAIVSDSGTITIATVDFDDVPVSLYIPAPLAYDTFTRANNPLGSTEVLSPDGVTIAALVWNFTAGVWAIVSNVAVATPVLGTEKVVNGVFAADTDWNKGAGWTISAGTANAAAASSDLSQIVNPLTTGIWYQLTYTTSGISGGTIRPFIGTFAGFARSTNATFTEIGNATSSAFKFTAAGLTGSIDNVSMKSLTLAELFATVLCSSADVIIDKAVTLSSAFNGLPDGIVVNLDSTSSPANFIIVYLDGRGNVNTDECVAGVYANKGTGAITYSAGAVLRVERSGTECRVFYNNLAVGSAMTMTANTNKNHGAFATSSSNSSDNVTIWARGTSGEYEAALNPL